MTHLRSSSCSPTRRPTRGPLVALLTVLALVAAACGGTEPIESTTAAPNGGEIVISGSDTTPTTAVLGTDTIETAPTTIPTEDAPATTEPATKGDAPDTAKDEGGDIEAPAEQGAAIVFRDSVLKQAVTATEADSDAVDSARFSIVMSMTPADGSAPLDLTIAGAYDTRVPATHLTMDMTDVFASLGDAEDDPFLEFFLLMFAEPIEVIQIGDTGWMSGDMFAAFAPEAAGKWIETTVDAGDDLGVDGLDGLSDVSNPNELLAQFADGSGTITEIGTETLRGVETTHYLVQIDLDALAADLDAAELAELEAEFGTTSGTLPLDIWLDADGNAHRFEMAIGAELLEGTGDDEFSSASIVFEIWDHGTDVGITPPPADLVIAEDELEMGFGF